MGQPGRDGERRPAPLTLGVFVLTCMVSACGSSPIAPDAPPAVISRVVVAGTSPGQGGAVVIPAEYVYNEIGGVILLPQSGLISVSLTISSAREAPFGQLNVYLLTGSGNADYCGQNLPDSPRWQSLPAGWTTSLTVTGFQIYRLPCAVTGVRVMFHTRNSGTLTPPTPAETIAEVTLPVSFTISQQRRP